MDKTLRNKIDKLSNEQLEELLLERMGDFSNHIIEPKAEQLIFKELRAIEGLSNYLQALLVKEIIRGFVADTDKQRWHAKGSHNSLFRLQQKLRVPQKKAAKSTMVNKRYA